MTVTNLLDRIYMVVEAAWNDVVPEGECLEWHVALVTEPTLGSANGESYVEMENFISMWVLTREAEDGLTMNGRVALRVSNASDENLINMVRNTWEAIMLERMETQFQE